MIKRIILLFFICSISQATYASLSPEERKTTFATTGIWPEDLIIGFTSINELVSYGWTWSATETIDLCNAGLATLDGILSVTGISAATNWQLKNNLLIDFPTDLLSLTKITAIDLSYNALTRLPDNIDQLSELQSFSCPHNFLSSLPPALLAISSLTTVNLQYNQLHSIDSAFLTQPGIWRFNGNPTTDMSDKEKKELFISEGKWPFGDQIGFTSVTELLSYGWNWIEQDTIDLRNAGLTNLDGILTVTGISSALNWNLSKNKFTDFPAELYSFPLISILDLSYNQLTSLPENISSFTALEFLTVGYNQLTSLPDSICTLSQLISLNVESNLLTELPAQLDHLSQIQTLNFDNNNISTVPDVLINMNWLSWCLLDHNNISTLPAGWVYADLPRFIKIKSNPIEQIERKTYFALNGTWKDAIQENFTSITELISFGWVAKNGYHLDLQGYNLASLDGIETLSYATQIETLNASHNQITSIPEAFSTLTSLQQATFNYNQITQLPAVLGKLPLLADLSMRNNKMNSIAEEFFTAPSLLILDLGTNSFTALSPNIQQLTRLQALNLEGNFLNDLPYTLTAMNSLLTCNLRFNQLKMESASTFTNAATFSVDLKGNPIIGQEIIADKPSDDLMRKLFFIQNRYWKDGVVTGFDSVNEMLSLGWQNDPSYGMNLYNAGLKSLTGLSNIPGIESIDILYAHNNQLTEIPAEIAAATSLRILHVENNQLQRCDAALSQLTQLNELYARNNQFTELSQGIYQAPALKILDLSHNLCTTLPDLINSMTQLERLFINDNRLSSVPNGLSQLSNLFELQLNNNQISNFPRDLSSMEQLHYLHLGNNNLPGIPNTVISAPNLFMVDVKKNKITQVPAQLYNNETISCFLSDIHCSNTTEYALLSRLDPNHQAIYTGTQTP